jgi:hypothetical protein
VEDASLAFFLRDIVATGDLPFLQVSSRRSLGMYGTSIFLDAANLNDFEEYGSIFSEQFQIFLEDGFKFVGVATWLAYFARYGFQKIIALRLGSEESS